uniref:Uncharacterized protein n=1 Tax=Mycena chlorophos TaxID=658473 RepID=A0ABQ0LRA9_MYCCL|nr:predicted protein [Mycena chlorophos]
MAALGDVEEQKRILGVDYEFVREEIDKARWPDPKNTASDSRKRPASTQLAAPVLQRARTASSSGSSRETPQIVLSDSE